MRVCLLCREYPPADGGGIGAYMNRYAHALAEGGCTVTVVTAAAGRSAATRTDTQGQSTVTVIEIPVAVDERWIGPLPDASDAEASAFHALGPTSLFAMAVATHLTGLHRSDQFDIVESPETGASLWFVLKTGAWDQNGRLLHPSLSRMFSRRASGLKTKIDARRQAEANWHCDGWKGTRLAGPTRWSARRTIWLPGRNASGNSLRNRCASLRPR